MVEIRLIGELQVVRDGAVLPLPASKKTRALLGYLAATGRPQLREKLCGLLWDGPDDPRAALRWSLTKLRPLLDDERVARVIADRERVEIAGADIDVAAVRAAVPGDVAGLRAVAPKLRGELLEGLDLPDCYRYDEWLRGEREALRRLACTQLATLVERVAGEAPEEALGHARAWLALDPLTDAPHAATIRLLVELDRKAEAAAQYASCVRLLERELGRGPTREIERLRAVVLASGSPSTSTSTSPSTTESPEPSPRTESDGVLVGRVQERAALARVVLEEGRVGLVLGDPGIGKSRLLGELARDARARGCEVYVGRGVEAELARPYGAWIDAIGDRFGAGAEDRDNLFAQLAAWLGARGDVLVILDDIQWLDDGSAALLHYLARTQLGGRVRLACGARPGELADNPAALRLVRGLAREQRVHQIGLSPLDAADTAALARAHAPGVDAARVVAESGGHPLFAVEIARALARGDTSWGSLDALLGERLELLDGTARELVPWGAALGAAFDADLLAQITGLPLAELARGIADLEKRAIVRAAGDDWDFVHDLVRAAAYHRITAPRRRLLHLQIARSLAALADPTGERAVAVAHHAAIGGDALLCARACHTAGERCLRLFAIGEAAGYAERGLAQVARVTGAARIPIHIDLLALAMGADPERRHMRAIAGELERAIVDAQAAGIPAAAARGWLAISHFHFESGDFTSAYADSIAAATADVPAADTLTRAKTLAHAAQCIALIGQIGEAEALAARAAEVMPAGMDLPELAFALSLIRHHQGDLAGAITLVERATELADRDGIPWLAGYGRGRAALHRLERGDRDEAIAHCDALRAEAHRYGGADVALGAVIALAAGDRPNPAALEAALATLRAEDATLHLAVALIACAEVELARGAVDSATRHAFAGIDAAERAQRPIEVALARALVARAAAVAGRAADAETELARARAGLPGPPPPRVAAALAAAADALCALR